MYTGILALIPADQNDDVVTLPLETLIAVISVRVANVKTAAECRAILEAKIGRELVAAEISDILGMISYITGGANVNEKLVRLFRLKNALNAIELGLGLTDAEIRTIAGI